jgi:heparan-alpha-glucosaminide N-acetyltransferase
MNSTTTAAQTPLIETAATTAPSRLASIDIFRGLTMVVMIFVNDLDSVHGLPWWTHHAPAKVDVMTYVDMVYPFFLFAIGLSLPLAVKARLKKTGSEFALWTHVIIRSASLIVLGLILANAEKGDPVRIGFNNNLWAILALLGAALYLSVYTGSGLGKTVHTGLRVLGLILVIAMYAIFRRTTPDGSVGWIDGSYPEILGLIGYTFLAVSILYIPTRRWLWTPFAWLIALVTFNALCIAKWIHLPKHLPLYFWPFDNGAMASITMAGIVTSVIFLGDHRWKALGQKISMAVALALAAVAAGRLLTPLGISKIRATPTWSLYCIGAAVASFAILYWVSDVKKKTGWAFFARPAGANTLLTYLLPDFYYFIVAAIGFTYFETHFNYGWPGVVCTVVFTACILAVAALLTRCKIRLQL